jgi:hypothetical protein
MIMNEKQLQSLLKKTQKKSEENLAKKQRLANKLAPKEPVVEENTEATDIFREMKKLPFSE